MIDVQEFINNINSYSKYDLKSNLLVMCAEYLKLEREYNYVKKQTSINASKIINQIAPFLDEKEKVECIYAIEPKLLKEEE